MDNDDDSITPLQFITQGVKYLRSKGKDISVTPISPEYPEFLKLYINGTLYGCWGSIGLASVIRQYRQPSYPKSFLKDFGLPTEI